MKNQSGNYKDNRTIFLTSERKANKNTREAENHKDMFE